MPHPASRRWELVEISRKLVLVGFLVLVRPGSMLQLCLGVATSLLYLLIQLNAQPFRDQADNALALFTGTSLVVLFFSCILLRAGELAELEQVSAILSTDRMRAAYAVPMSFTVVVLSSSILLGLLLSVPLLLLAIRKESKMMVIRWVSDQYRVVPRQLPAGRFHAFLSHVWSSSQDQAQTVKGQLRNLVPGIKIWLDVDNMRSKAGT